MDTNANPTNPTNPSPAAAPATETLEARLARLELAPKSDERRTSLDLAHVAGVDDETLIAIATAPRLARKDTIVIPFHRFETLSRGRGWARKGRGAKAVWGERELCGYRVGPGYWTVGGHDGFSRKGEDEWTVEHVRVGAVTWTIAR